LFQQAVSADIIPNSAVGIFSLKTEGSGQADVLGGLLLVCVSGPNFTFSFKKKHIGQSCVVEILDKLEKIPYMTKEYCSDKCVD
jgi:hypothetical protein